MLRNGGRLSNERPVDVANIIMQKDARIFLAASGRVTDLRTSLKLFFSITLNERGSFRLVAYGAIVGAELDLSAVLCGR